MNRFYLTLLILIIASRSLIAQNQFISIWNSEIPGVSANNQVLLPTAGNVNFKIAWEEVGNPSNMDELTGSGEVLLTFPKPGVYRIKLSQGSGSFFRFFFMPKSLGTSDNDKILDVSQWGNTNWTECPIFMECSNLNVTANDAPDLSDVSQTSSMFFLCSNLEGTPAFNTWGLSSILSTRTMFTGCVKFNSPIGDWDVSNVTDMDQMFSGATIFNQYIGDWEVGKVENFYQMFAGATYFNQNIGEWDVSAGTNFIGMFQDAQHFDQPIGDWDISGATSLWAMFYNATSFNHPLANWDVSGVTDLTATFAFAAAFDQPLDDWDVSSVTSLWGTFLYAQNFNRPLPNWNTSNVEDMRTAFTNAYLFNQSLATWDISSATSMEGALDNSSLSCTNFDATLSGWAQNPSSPTNLSLGAAGLVHSASAADRLHLTNIKGWSIVGDTYSETCTALPVTLIAFSANYQEGATLLEWRTSEEAGFSHFEIERSADGRHFEKIREVTGGATNGGYQAIDAADRQKKGMLYYRLRMVDFDGSQALSTIVSVEVPDNENYVAFPNPATRFVTLQGLPLGAKLQILDWSGRTRYRHTAEASNRVDLDGFSAGLYWIRIVTEDGAVFNQKLVINR